MNKPQAIITENNQLQCHIHHHPINRFKCEPTGASSNTMQVMCPECETKNSTKEPHLVTVQAYSASKSFILNLIDVPALPEDPSFQTKAPLDFSSHKIECFIYDYGSLGYHQGGLVYIQNENLLVACSMNGRVSLWSVGDSIENISTFVMHAGAKCAKYVITKQQRKLFVAGTDYGIWIFELQPEGKKMEFVNKLECEIKIQDMEYIEDEQKILVVGSDQYIRIWELENFTFIGKLDAQVFAGELMIDKLYSVIYMKENNKLAVEYSKGFFVVDMTKEGFDFDQAKEPQHFSIPNRRAAGLAYFPKIQKFFLKTSRKSFTIINAVTLKPSISIGDETSGSGYQFPFYKFHTNEQQNQVITCGDSSSFFLYRAGEKSYRTEYFNGLLIRSGSIVVIPDKYRIIIGDEYSGTLLVLRTNIPTQFPFSNFSSNFNQHNMMTVPPMQSGLFGNYGGKDEQKNTGRSKKDQKSSEDEKKTQSPRRSNRNKSKNRSRSKEKDSK